MTLHLEEISAAVAPDAHAVLVMDQAGWHTSGKLDVPAILTILTLPPRSPELNLVENIWQFLRDNWLSNRVFSSHGRHRRPLLRRLEQAHRSTMENHVDRTPGMGTSVVISGTWYKCD